MRQVLRTFLRHLTYGCAAAQYKQGLETAIQAETYIVRQRIANEQATLAIEQFMDFFQNVTKQKCRLANYYRLSSCEAFNSAEVIAKS